MIFVIIFIVVCCVIDSLLKSNIETQNLKNANVKSNKVSELKVWSDMLKEGQITQEQFDEKVKELS